MKGFKVFETAGINLAAGQEIPLDAQLEPAGEATEVEVTGQKVAQVETGTAEVAGTVTETEVKIGKPQALFTVPPLTRFQVSRDGQRFLIAMPVEGAPASASITVDTDWRAELGERK